MKNLVFLAVCICLSLGLGYAKEMLPDPAMKTLICPNTGQSIRPTRTTPTYSFTRTPTAIMTSYYDYMIGSYNSLPLRLIPVSAGGGYFMSYQGKRSPTSTRRVFYAHIDAQGNLANNNELTTITNSEGYPGLGVDPVSGKPMYAWHANTDTDVELEVQFCSDAFIYGFSGLFNEAQTIYDNPSIVNYGNGNSTSNNEFIWPTVQVGPSPMANMRRVYVLARNSVSHSYGPCENVKIAYADFNADMFEVGTPLVWSYTSIPEMDQWNHDIGWRRPFHALTVDQMGNIYYAGYHFATAADGSTHIEEADFDVFKCDNFGAGTWTRVSEYSHIPSCNPPATPGGGAFFVDGSNAAVPDEQLLWALANSSHLNAVSDNQGRIIVPGLWTLLSTAGSYWLDFHVVKCMIYDPVTNSFNISEIYPQKDPADHFNHAFTPWDTEAPWGEPEYTQDDAGNWHLALEMGFPFPHWDNTLHTDAMLFHYNNTKLSEVNEEDMMVAVWQDSYRARRAHEQSNPDYLAYAQTPEIFIAVSSDQGNSWSDPIILNNVETQEFANIKPMWVYPADKVKFVGMQGENKIGQIGLMFYNDYTWGANAISPPAHPTNDGGQVMFAELEIVFPNSTYQPPQDPFGYPLVLSSSMTLMAGLEINDLPASEGDVLAAFVNVNGLPQLRGKESIQVNAGIAGCLLQIYSESSAEEVYFKVWNSHSGSILNTRESLASIVNGSVGSWPDSLFWLHAYQSHAQSIGLQNGWNLFSLNTHPLNTSISAIFGDILGVLECVKSPDGIYEPGNPYSTLTELMDGDGYLLKMIAPAAITVDGISIAEQSPLLLAEGWNLVGYLPQTAMPVDIAIASISSHLIQVKGTEGVYEPNNPYSTLSTMNPGRAYWMKLYSDATLIYPSNGRFAHCASTGQTIPENPVLKSNSQSVLLGFAEGISSGDVVQAYVGDELRGSASVMEVNGRLGTLLQIFSEQRNESIDFRLRKAASGITVALYPALQSSPGSILGDYSEGLFYTLEEGTPEAPELTTALGRAYPNPFKQGTNITLSIGKDTQHLKVQIYNVRGQKVKTLLQGKSQAGALHLNWDGCDEGGRRMPSGVYFCRLEEGKTKQSRKLLLLK